MLASWRWKPGREAIDQQDQGARGDGFQNAHPGVIVVVTGPLIVVNHLQGGTGRDNDENRGTGDGWNCHGQQTLHPNRVERPAGKRSALPPVGKAVSN
jgi:hypothetical protein